MRLFSLAIVLIVLSSAVFSAEFAVEPYLYPSEKDTQITHTAFELEDGSSADILKINGDEAFLILDGKPVEDKGQMSDILNSYFKKNHYPSAEEFGQLIGQAIMFNDSRNYQTRYGPAEYVCWNSGTFLAHRPCDDLASCMATASLVCMITGSDGCIIDLLGTYILDYRDGVVALNSAMDKFESAFNSFSPKTSTSSLEAMEESLNEMKTAADKVAENKLRFPEKTVCMDCIGVCPEPHFNYEAITSGKNLIATLKEKVKPFAMLSQTIDKIFLSTQDRIKYRDGEEKALIFTPRYSTVKSKFVGLKAKAVEAKALVADAEFVKVADSFLNKEEELEYLLEMREFDDFDSLLSSYEFAGSKLLLQINNSTSSYYGAFEASDEAGDAVLLAQWSVNKLSQESVDAYNAIAEKKISLDKQFSPPMTTENYVALAEYYSDLERESEDFVGSSTSLQNSFFGAGNTLSRISVDGTMLIASSITPISFQTRQGFAKYVPPLFMVVVDLSILAVAMLAFMAVFYAFRGFFRNKLAVSGWLLTMFAFAFVLLIGSVGFYSIVMSAEKYTSFSDFMSTVYPSDKVAVVVDESGVSGIVSEAMHSCSDQVAGQLSLMGKDVYRYYLNGNTCIAYIPVGYMNNSTNMTYDVQKNLETSACLDNMPDMPVIDLKWASDPITPVFTTVVTKQALFRGDANYYNKKPMCDPANVLG